MHWKVYFKLLFAAIKSFLSYHYTLPWHKICFVFWISWPMIYCNSHSCLILLFCTRARRENPNVIQDSVSIWITPTIFIDFCFCFFTKFKYFLSQMSCMPLQSFVKLTRFAAYLGRLQRLHDNCFYAFFLYKILCSFVKTEIILLHLVFTHGGVIKVENRNSYNFKNKK